jgi:Na+/melibiose symporter-like transporter
MSDIIENNNLPKNINDEDINKTEKSNSKEQENKEIIYTKEEIKYGETPYRWYFVTSYCLCVFANQFQWVAFSAIATDFSKNYHKPLWKVNMFSLIYMIIYPFACIPEGWLIDDYSIRVGLIITAGCNIIGAGLKLLVNKDESLASCYIGQILAGLFQPALINSPGKIAANWFRDDIRTIICTICCLAVTIGTLVGFLWNLAFIDENIDENKFKNQVFNYILSEFILITIFCFPTFFIIKDRPDIPPSPSQNEDNIKRPGFIESLKLLFTNKRFIFLFLAYLFVVGYFDTMSTIINSLFDLYTITGKQSSVIYAVSSIAGMIASLVISWLLDKYKKFKLFMIILSITGTIFQALFTFLLELIETKGLNAYAIGLVLYSLINMVVVTFFTIGMNYACEITYPVGESINGSVMASMPQVASIGVSFLCDHFISHVRDKKWISNVILLAFFAASCIFVFLLDEKLNRQEIENSERIKDNQDRKETITVGICNT